MKIPKKHCIYCYGLFLPNPRLGDGQKACPQKRCQRKRHREAHQRWRAKNSKAYRGRYGNTKKWLKKHPGYLKGWRADNPDKVEADNRRRLGQWHRDQKKNSDIQDEILIGEMEVLEEKNSDIQDALPMKMPVIRRFSKVRLILRSDIQDSIALRGGDVAHSGP